MHEKGLLMIFSILHQHSFSSSLSLSHIYIYIYKTEIVSRLSIPHPLTSHAHALHGAAEGAVARVAGLRRRCEGRVHEGGGAPPTFRISLHGEICLAQKGVGRKKMHERDGVGGKKKERYMKVRAIF